MEVIYCIGAYNGVQNIIKTIKNISHKHLKEMQHEN
jgi:hypothetical protein